MSTDYDDTPETAPPIPQTQRSKDAAKAREMRDSPQMKKLLAEHRAKCARENACCWLCGGEIRYDLKYPHPFCFETDHAITVKERPDLLMDVLNFRPSHRDCNESRGTDAPPLTFGDPSEIW
jgi:hypothetical protein